MSPRTRSVRTLLLPGFSRLDVGMLCFAVREFFSFTAWQHWMGKDANLCWRVKDGK